MSSLKVLCAEFMLSDNNGLGVRRSWLLRKVAESFTGSTKDGPIQISPDPVTMIDADLYWYNDTPDPQDIWVIVSRAPRSVVVQSPCTVIILEGSSSQIGENPQADYPSMVDDAFGGGIAIDRLEVSSGSLQYGRFFFDGDDTQSYKHVGIVPPGQAFHFWYISAVQTPGLWTEATDFVTDWEADARWVRLIAMAMPVDVATALIVAPGSGGSGS